MQAPASPLPDRSARRRERDTAVSQALRRVRLLRHLRWPPEVEARFLAQAARGRPDNPGVCLESVAPSIEDSDLVELQSTLDRSDPAEDFLWRTVESGRQVQAMTASLGTAAFVERGIEVYGRPETPVAPGAPSALDGAHHFIAATRPLDRLPERPTMDAEAAATWLADHTRPHLDSPPLDIELDPGLSSLAAAGSRRIRLRADAHYSVLQLRQLLEHEALVHSATRRNGADQPVLRALSIGPARTTAAQEGLATFAELITDCMDLHRLRRIALRVVAVHMALDGADFVELWEWFQEQGQSAEESFHSVQRILRGGDGAPGGGVFPKDGVYVQGLIGLHALFLAGMREHDRGLPQRLFAGRMTLGDVVRLRPLFEDGSLQPAARVPTWAEEQECLAAFLSFSALTTRFDLDAMSLSSFEEGD